MHTGIKFLQLAHGKGLQFKYQTEYASGIDLPAAIPEDDIFIIGPGQFELVPTGICLTMPVGCEGQVRPRSGLAAKFGITVLNSPGTIDADFRGEIKVILINHGKEVFVIKRGDRIAQLVFMPVFRAYTMDQTEEQEKAFEKMAKISSDQVLDRFYDLPLPVLGGSYTSEGIKGAGGGGSASGPVAGSNGKSERGSGGFGSTGR